MSDYLSMKRTSSGKIEFSDLKEVVRCRTELFIQPSSKFYYLSNVVVSATGNQGVKFKTKVVLLRSQGEN